MNRGNLSGHHKNQSHRDQVKGVRLVLVRFSFAPHTVGAVSNRTGPRPYGNECHKSSSVAHPSINGSVFPRPSLHGNWQFTTLKPCDLHPKTLNLIPMGTTKISSKATVSYTPPISGVQRRQVPGWRIPTPCSPEIRCVSTLQTRQRNPYARIPEVHACCPPNGRA